MANNNQQNNPTDEQLKDQLEDAVRREMEARNRYLFKRMRRTIMKS